MVPNSRQRVLEIGHLAMLSYHYGPNVDPVYEYLNVQLLSNLVLDFSENLTVMLCELYSTFELC